MRSSLNCYISQLNTDPEIIYGLQCKRKNRGLRHGINERPDFISGKSVSQSATCNQLISHHMSEPCETLPCSSDFHDTLFTPLFFASIAIPMVDQILLQVEKILYIKLSNSFITVLHQIQCLNFFQKFCFSQKQLLVWSKTSHSPNLTSFPVSVEYSPSPMLKPSKSSSSNDL